MTKQPTQTDAKPQPAGVQGHVPSIWGRYWRAYGGWRAVIGSRYFWTAVLLTALCFPFWSSPHWWETPAGVLPDLLGFTLGGMAILIGVCEARVMKVLSLREPDQQASDLAIIVSTFAHFVIVQAFALLAALLCKALYVPIESLPWVGPVFANHPNLAYAWASTTQYVGWSASFLLFMYSILLIFATTLELFRVSSLLEMIFVVGKDQEGEVCRYNPHAESRPSGGGADEMDDEGIESRALDSTPQQSDNKESGK